ncbi:hypothetical protein [Candidatus Nitrospira bockiana]
MARMLMTLSACFMIPLTGCAQGARLVQDNEAGGIVMFLYQEDRGGPAFSKYRAQAFEIMKLKCPDGYTIVKEGEARGGAISSIEGREDQVTRRWAFQFRCKNP